MSFRLKTILGIALIEAVLLFILIWSSMVFLSTSNEEQLKNRVETLARVFATTTQDAVLTTNLASLESAVINVLTNPGVVYARVRGRQDVVLAEGGDPKVLKRPFKADREFDTIDDGVYDSFIDITIHDTRYGRVEIGISIDAIQEVLRAARERMALIAVIEMGLVALFSFFLGLYLTRGLASLKDASQRLAGGELGYKINVVGRDELAETAKAFNDMSQKLQLSYNQRRQAEEDLAKLNEDLELRVALRTEQLSEAYAKIEHQAMHDPLTKLPNRMLFQDRLRQAILIGEREKTPFAVVMLDLNRFKEINDSLGHHSGDLVLQEAAIRLRKALRRSDTVARLGGDEFALILPTVQDRSVAIGVLEKIHNILEAPMTVDGQALHIGASLGLALYPLDAAEPEALTRRADLAMYDCKRRKATFTLYTSDLEQGTTERLQLRGELRQAAERDEFVLYYQPKIDLSNNRVNGVEALIRWQHPRRGLLFPDDFLPLAEEGGLMSTITSWVLNEALRQCRLWLNRGKPLSMSINISVTNLQDPKFPDLVSKALTAHGVDPKYLELEITETGLMVEPPRAMESIRQLSELGVQIIIDDFGTGYSSMAYLRRLPIAKIKVDKSFVRDVLASKNDDVIVRSIIGLGHNLGLNVVAEGVESDEVWDYLRTLNCDAAQGYGFSRPIPADELEHWLVHSPFGDSTPKT